MAETFRIRSKRVRTFQVIEPARSAKREIQFHRVQNLKGRNITPAGAKPTEPTEDVVQVPQKIRYHHHGPSAQGLGQERLKGF